MLWQVFVRSRAVVVPPAAIVSVPANITFAAIPAVRVTAPVTVRVHDVDILAADSVPVTLSYVKAVSVTISPLKANGISPVITVLDI